MHSTSPHGDWEMGQKREGAWAITEVKEGQNQINNLVVCIEMQEVRGIHRKTLSASK